jgi:hypothetical protein
LAYEVAICIHTGHIVWIHGPKPATTNDITMFRSALLSNLDAGERVEADDGYVGESPRYVKCPMSFTNQVEMEAMQAIVRRRHETVNARFKDWGCLGQKFRHDLLKHGDCFRSVAILTQLAIEEGEVLFPVVYSNDIQVARMVAESAKGGETLT